MKCIICRKGETKTGTTTVTLERNGMTLVVKCVPAEVCTNCGEAYVDEETTGRLLATADQLADSGTEVEIREYIAA